MKARADAYARAVLLTADGGNIKGADEALSAAVRELYASSNLALGKLIARIALDAVKAKKPGGDVLSLSLMEHVRSLAAQGSMNERVELFMQISDGLDGKINDLPLDSFAGTTAKLIWVAAQCVLSVARGDNVGARQFAQMIDENTRGEFGFGKLVNESTVAPPSPGADRFVNLFLDPATALEVYNKEAREAFGANDYERLYAVSEAYLKLNPKAIGAATNKATALLRMKKYEPALLAFSYAISLAPNDPFVWLTWLQRAEAAWYMGQAGPVMESLLAIHRLNPGEMKGILTEKDARGGAFKDFLQRHVSHPEFQSDARMLLSAYYS